MTTFNTTDLIVQTTTTTGTGTLTLGSAVSGFLALGSGMNGLTLPYSLEDANGTARETGWGVYTHSGTTFTRAGIWASTNGGAAISLSSGTHKFRISNPAAFFDGLTGPIQTQINARHAPNFAWALKTDTASTSSTYSTYVDTGLSISISPSSTTARVLIGGFIAVSGGHSVHLTLTDGSNTELAVGDAGGGSQPRVFHTHFNTTTVGLNSIPFFFSEVPGSTSSKTYKVRFCSNSASATTAYINRGGAAEANNNAWGRTVSGIWAMQVTA